MSWATGSSWNAAEAAYFSWIMTSSIHNSTCIRKQIIALRRDQFDGIACASRINKLVDPVFVFEYGYREWQIKIIILFDFGSPKENA
jgi:hypothetical protein